MPALLCKVFTWGEEISSSSSFSVFCIAEWLHLIWRNSTDMVLFHTSGFFCLRCWKEIPLSWMVDASFAVFIEDFCLSRCGELLFTEWTWKNFNHVGFSFGVSIVRGVLGVLLLIVRHPSVPYLAFRFLHTPGTISYLSDWELQHFYLTLLLTLKREVCWIVCSISCFHCQWRIACQSPGEALDRRWACSVTSICCY